MPVMSWRGQGRSGQGAADYARDGERGEVVSNTIEVEIADTAMYTVLVHQKWMPLAEEWHEEIVLCTRGDFSLSINGATSLANALIRAVNRAEYMHDSPPSNPNGAQS
jgi:hypothetical protein